MLSYYVFSLLNLYNRNIPIAGTSVGTAIQSELMLSGNGSETISGLATWKNFIVDQHYLVRNREYRLLGPLSIILYLHNGRELKKLHLFDGDSYKLKP